MNYHNLKQHVFIVLFIVFFVKVVLFQSHNGFLSKIFSSTLPEIASSVSDTDYPIHETKNETKSEASSDDDDSLDEFHFASYVQDSNLDQDKSYFKINYLRPPNQLRDILIPPPKNS